MKKLRKYFVLPLFLVQFILIVVLPVQEVGAAENPPKVGVHAYAVIDANSGEILFGENENKRIYPASTVKMMTAVIAVENAELTKKITVKQSVLKKIPSDASGVGLRAGQTYTLEQLLNLLLIASAADAADTIAEGVCKSTEKFIVKMNQKAAELGLSQTSFDNTVGLDIGNNYTKTYSTAADIAKLARYAMSKKEIRDIVSKKNYELKNIGLLKNTNRFYFTAAYSKERYSIIGTKTGTTSAAGHALVTTARDADGHEVICAFFGNISGDSTYKDTRKLFDYTFSNHDGKNLTLSLSFYDMRYRRSEDILTRLCDEGLIGVSQTGEFQPAVIVKQGYFVDTINAICNTELLAWEKNKKVTVKDFASILYEAYPLAVNDEDILRMEALLEQEGELLPEEMTELTALYTAEILPETCGYDIDTLLTREDMILIADRMEKYIETAAKGNLLRDRIAQQ